MLNEVLLAIIQAATEFLPVSSSGHLALFSKLFKIEQGNLFFFAVLHVASLLAVLVFTKKELSGLLSFKKEHKRLWNYLIIATIPAVTLGLLFKNSIKDSLSSVFFIGNAFIFTGLILLLTKFSKKYSDLTYKNSIFIGLMQAWALFPGISRSGMAISAAMFSGIEKERAIKFSFLLFIPLVLGAMILELGEFYFSWNLLVGFLVCFVLSLIFLNLLYAIVRKGWFWLFSIYLFFIGLLSIALGFMGF